LLKHWEAVLREEEQQHGLRMCPKLTKAHVHPGPFDKMNVAKAFQVISILQNKPRKLASQEKKGIGI